MSRARGTQLLEGQTPSRGAHIVPWDNSVTPCAAFHCNVDGVIDVEFADTTTATLAVVAGISYGYRINKFLNTGDMPEMYYFDI